VHAVTALGGGRWPVAVFDVDAFEVDVAGDLDDLVAAAAAGGGAAAAAPAAAAPAAPAGGAAAGGRAAASAANVCAVVILPIRLRYFATSEREQIRAESVLLG